MAAHRGLRFWRGVQALVFCLAFLGLTPVQAQTPAESGFKTSGPEIDVALVLAVDISFSMDMEELALQRQGYIEALTSPLVLDAIRRGMLGRIAVTYIEWAGLSTRHVIADWTVIEDLKTAEAFVAQIRSAPVRRARRTSITGAIEFSMDRLRAAEFRPLRRVIDISGDGPNNEGHFVHLARDRALASGVTINGLPIILKRPFNSSYDIESLDEYYRDCVIGGPGAFMVTIREREEFAAAIKHKILREVAEASISDYSPIPVQSSNPDCMVGERQWRQNWERN
jgi:Protein of unknown function (DUF1194)